MPTRRTPNLHLPLNPQKEPTKSNTNICSLFVFKIINIFHSLCIQTEIPQLHTSRWGHQRERHHCHIRSRRPWSGSSHAAGTPAHPNRHWRNRYCKSGTTKTRLGSETWRLQETWETGTPHSTLHCRTHPGSSPFGRTDQHVGGSESRWHSVHIEVDSIGNGWWWRWGSSCWYVKYDTIPIIVCAKLLGGKCLISLKENVYRELVVLGEDW